MMILADKIIQERKRNGWTQEELAELMNVSRQAVSKWESAQSIPDIEKVIRLSELFGVSTDYLFKDELEDAEYIAAGDLEDTHKVTLAEAQYFLIVKEKTAKLIALGVFLCILSPIGLILLGAGADQKVFGISEAMAVGLGLLLLVLFVTPAVALFIYSGAKTADFTYLNDEIFETEYGVTGMVKERQKKYHDRYVRYNILATCLVILSTVPLFLSFLLTSDVVKVMAVCLLLVIVASSMLLFIINGIRWESMLKLLQEGDYSKQAKERSPALEAIATVYWLILTAAYVGYSLVTGNWQISWIIWPIGGLLYGAIAAVVNLLVKK